MEREKRTRTIEDTLFVIGNIGIVCVLILWWWYRAHLCVYDFSCRIHRITGLYCPGCGGTRAFDALMHGHLIRSFCYHPGVCCGAIAAGWFMVSWYIQRLTGNRCQIGMRFRTVYVYIWLAIVMIQWIVKCIILFYV